MRHYPFSLDSVVLCYTKASDIVADVRPKWAFCPRKANFSSLLLDISHLRVPPHTHPRKWRASFGRVF